jgi:hypothetical protein
MAWIFNLFGRKKLQLLDWLAGTVQALVVRESGGANDRRGITIGVTLSD